MFMLQRTVGDFSCTDVIPAMIMESCVSQEYRRFLPAISKLCRRQTAKDLTGPHCGGGTSVDRH